MIGTGNVDEERQKDTNPGITISTGSKLYRGTIYSQDNQSTGLNERSLPPENEFKAINSYKYYNMKHLKRGKALIFNMEKFSDFEDRTGSAKDVEELQKTFCGLEFEVITYIDKTVDMLKSILNNIAANADDDCDCLILVYMSHGEAGDKLWAKDKRIFIKELWEPFIADKCPALAGKPKLFFIQACRGYRLESATFVRDAGAVNDEKQTCALPYERDILIANSTIEDRQAVRCKIQGSWFIQALCKELNENGRREDIMSLLTTVNRRVAMGEFKGENSEVFKQQPVIVSTLTRELIFEKK